MMLCSSRNYDIGETGMRILIQDQNSEVSDEVKAQFDRVIQADGKYAPCQGCFKCWTKNPATCDMSDSLQEICRVIGQADELVIVTENWYGGYSPAVKNILDRSIGTSTPMSTYRGWQMHHTLRYGRHARFNVYVTGDVSEKERQTWKLMIERNAINEGFRTHLLHFTKAVNKLEG